MEEDGNDASGFLQCSATRWRSTKLEYTKKLGYNPKNEINNLRQISEISVFSLIEPGIAPGFLFPLWLLPRHPFFHCRRWMLLFHYQKYDKRHYSDWVKCTPIIEKWHNSSQTESLLSLGSNFCHHPRRTCVSKTTHQYADSWKH